MNAVVRMLTSIRLTVFDAYRRARRIAPEKRQPFRPLKPNAETIKAMKAARRGDVAVFGSVEELMADLRAD